MAELVTRGGLEVMALEELEACGVDAVITTRAGGISKPPYDTLNLGLHVGDAQLAVLENRARLAAAMGVQLDDLVFMDQVHGNGVSVVDDDDRGRGARVADHVLTATDALVTTAIGLPMVVLVADCAPLVLVDPVARVLSVIHAGWRGTAAGVTDATIAAMALLGAETARMVAVIGPTVSPDAYEVGQEVVDALRSRALDEALDTSGAAPHVDLVRANARSLELAGLAPGAITLVAARSDDDLFFSHRRQQPCGRFALIARLVP